MTMTHNFVPGDVVKPVGHGYALRSGGQQYGSAVVVQSNPLVLVSAEADMRWESTVEPEKLQRCGTADPQTLKRCTARL